MHMNTLNFIDLDAHKKENTALRHARIVMIAILSAASILIGITVYKWYEYYSAAQTYHAYEQRIRAAGQKSVPLNPATGSSEHNNPPRPGKILEPNSRLLRDITEKLPRSMWFTHFAKHADSRVTIKGMSKNINDIYTFTQSLQMISYIKNVIIQGVAEHMKNNKKYFSFTLTLECAIA